MKRLSPLVGAALLGASLAAQTPADAPPGQAPAQPPPFRAGTVVIEVDAIVTDGSGRFVPSLTAPDFELLEDGKRQPIEFIYAVTGTTVTPAPAPPVPDAILATATPRTAPGRVFVLVFDQEHMQEAAFKRLRDAAIAFLTNDFKPGDVGGVVVGNTIAGSRLTSDREALLAAIRDAKPNFSKASRRLELLEWPRFNSEGEAVRIASANDGAVLAQLVRRACDDDPTACKNYDPAPLIRSKAQGIVSELRPSAARTLRTLQALASGIARLPGRKTVILMTDGFFLEESSGDLRQIVGTAARSNVRIYSLDARGLDTRQTNDPRQRSAMDAGGGLPLDAYNTLEDGPNMLANDTGGYPIRHTNKFAEALGEIARDTSSYYVIGYSPSNAVMDGAFRKITVRVTRPGLKVRARRGYLASASGAPTTPPSGPEPTAGRPAPEAAAAASPVPSAMPRPAAVTPPVPGAAPDTRVPSASASTTAAAAGLVLRPDASGRIHELASREGEAEANKSVASRGWDRYQKGDLEGAANLLARAAAESDARPWVRYALGYAELGLRHLEAASREWETVRAAVPEYRPVYLDLADAYLQMENYGRAVAVLRAAETRWPGDADTLNALGTIQVRRGALDDAIHIFKKAADANPDDALAYFNLGRTYELRYFKMRRYIPADGQWMGNRQDIKDAVASYERYLKLGGPFSAQARNALQNLQWLQ
jgi:VWFA-related protein